MKFKDTPEDWLVAMDALRDMGLDELADSLEHKDEEALAMRRCGARVGIVPGLTAEEAASWADDIREREAREREWRDSVIERASRSN